MKLFMKYFPQLFSMSKEERDVIFDTGFFNEICQGYLMLTLQALGKSEKEIDEAQSKLNEMFDFNTAKEARSAYSKSNISKFEQLAPSEVVAAPRTTYRKDKPMRKIKFGEDKISYEEYIKTFVLLNLGTDSICSKADLIKLCEDRGIDVSKDTKVQLYEKLIESGLTPYDFERVGKGIGVSSQHYQEEFGITHADVKWLEKHERLIVVGRRRFRTYGKDRYVPVYSLLQFATISVEELADMLSKKKQRSKK